MYLRRRIAKLLPIMMSNENQIYFLLIDIFICSRPSKSGPVRTKLLKDVVVVKGQPEETADPFPVMIWVELDHRERRLDAVV